MKKQLFSLLILLLSSPSFGQNTYIPDDHFELALIDMGLDNVMNDSVATGNIDTLSFLNIAWRDIDDLTGIENFSSLIFLQVNSNNLSSLDLSQNTQLVTLHADLNALTMIITGNNPNLKSLFCRANLLTGLDVSGLPALYSLSVENNLITQLDVSHNPLLNYLNVQGNLLWNINTASNPELKGLICSEMPISVIDVSQNPLLNTFHCSTTLVAELDLSHNPEMLFLNCNNLPNLHSLNMKSGNNAGMLSFSATNNPELFCIEVDTPAYSQLNWTNVDSWVNFQEDCILGLEESAENTFGLYPNPAISQIHFSTPLSNVSIQDMSGRTLKISREVLQEMEVSEFPAGVYLLRGTMQNGKPISLRFIRADF